MDILRAIAYDLNNYGYTGVYIAPRTSANLPRISIYPKDKRNSLIMVELVYNEKLGGLVFCTSTIAAETEMFNGRPILDIMDPNSMPKLLELLEKVFPR